MGGYCVICKLTTLILMCSCNALCTVHGFVKRNKNSSGDEIANVNFTQCARKLRECAEITPNNGHYTVQGHQFWYQSKAHIGPTTFY